MRLCLDIGNTHIYGGLFEGEVLSHQFRYPSMGSCTSDEIGIFLKNYLREIDVPFDKIKAVAYCSVVPSIEYSIRSAFIKYFSLEPFILQAGARTGLQIKYKNPTEVGTDRIANAIAGAHLFPGQNIIIADLGTTTTFEAITAKAEFLGGTIIPGLQMQVRALHEHTANLPPVRIVKATSALGQSTTANIQSGLYYGQMGAIKETLYAFTKELFNNVKPVVIGTGGFSYLYEDENLFTTIIPDLVLQGLRIAYDKNH